MVAAKPDVSRLIAGGTLHVPIQTYKIPTIVSAWLWVTLVGTGWTLFVWLS